MVDNLVPLYDDGIKQVLLNPDTDNLVFKGFGDKSPEEILSIMVLANKGVVQGKKKVQDEKKKFRTKQKTLDYQLSKIERLVKECSNADPDL